MKSADVLLYQLQKLYWQEAKFEQLAICDARLELMGEYKDELDILESNSQENINLIENWLNLKNIDPSQCKLFNTEKTYNFVGMDAPHIFRVLYKYAIYIKTIYEDVSKVDQNVITYMIPNENYADNFHSDIYDILPRQKESVEICMNICGGASAIFGI
ncbi:hypothetical protein [Methanohalobium sp.]|uniref:hypothetical protein n=1 Tax=Methanohalobium sp. TaxID=2837493 RepID=UPI0025E8E105|nr:hypothetical protein [Methanohalobium sp.]